MKKNTNNGNRLKKRIRERESWKNAKFYSKKQRKVLRLGFEGGRKTHEKNCMTLS